MSKAKDEFQQNQEIQCYDIPGKLNSYEPPQNRYSSSRNTESSGLKNSWQAQDFQLRKQQDRLSSVQNRTAMVVQTGDCTSYEELIASFATPDNNTAAQKQVIKVFTRNAESKTYFLSSPWNYDDSGVGKYKRTITEELHTYAIEGYSDERPQLGNFFEQVYEDGTQQKAALIRKTKAGFSNFPQSHSSKGIYTNNVEALVLDEGLKSSDIVSSTSYLPSTTYDEGPLVTAVKSGGWQPKYSPLAAKAPRKGAVPARPTCNIGTNRKSVEGSDTKRQDFGPRIRPNTDAKQFHPGQDMKYPGGSGYPIVSVAAGEIVDIQPRKGQPKTVTICIVTVKHKIPPQLEKQGYEVHTRYMHMFQVAANPMDGESRLQVGDDIAAGQILGFLGGGRGWPGSGNTTGPHLHFEVCVRKRISADSFEYDNYEQDKDRVTIFNKSHDPAGYGSVDPLHFEYKEVKTFNFEKVSELKDNLPKTIQEREDAAAAAAAAAAALEEIELGGDLFVGF